MRATGSCAAATGPLSRFIRARDGAATIELVVWIPFFFALFFTIVDGSILFYRYGQMWDAARDTARAMALRQIPATTEAAVAQIASDPFIGGMAVTATAAGDSVTVRMRGQVSAMSPFGLFTVAQDTLAATVTMGFERDGLEN